MENTRFKVIIGAFVAFYIFLQARLINLTLFSDKQIDKSIINNNQKRGTIYSKNKIPLALTVNVYSLYIRPDLLSTEMKNYFYKVLRENTKIDENSLNNIFKNSSFTWIKRNISVEDKKYVEVLINNLKKNNFLKKDEFGLVKEEGRFYPEGASLNVCGITGIDNYGLTGLEYYFDDYLKKGYNVITTIDEEISKIAFEELKKAVYKNDADSGSVVIVDVYNNSILAICGYPTYDPNDISSLTKDNMKFIPVEFILEPGSVMKQFSALYALERGIADPLKPVYYCGGRAELAGHNFKCLTPHGNVNLSKIIQKSCNIGMIQVADRFKDRDFYEFLSGFGFGKVANLPLPGISSGILRDPKNWSVFSKYMISIGQEIGVSALQLAQACMVIANKGIYEDLKLISAIEDENGRDLYTNDGKTKRLCSEKNANDLLKMMETVVEEGGTALRAKVEGIQIAGKTGTGQVAKENGSGYYDNIFNALFIGYIPSSNPRFVIVITLNKVKKEKHQGGQIAAPLFSNIVRRMIISTDYFLIE